MIALDANVRPSGDIRAWMVNGTTAVALETTK